MDVGQLFAYSYVLILSAVVVFQLCLIFGVPWGEYTQGGRYKGTLPVNGRIAAGFSIPILIFLGASISSAAGLIPVWERWTAYVAIAIQSLNTILNWISPSQKEKLLWGPITSFLLLFAAYVVFVN